MSNIGLRKQAIIALIPAYGTIAILLIGFLELKDRRGNKPAIVFLLLCSLLFAASLFAFILSILLIDMPLALLIVCVVMIVWGLAYITLGIEAALLRGMAKSEANENNESNLE